MPLIHVPQTDLGACGRKKPGASLRPLDESDGVVEVALEVPPLRIGHALEAVKVEMGNVNLTAIEMADGVGRTRDRCRHA